MVMVSNATGMEVGLIAGSNPGRVGHLYSPGGERGPWMEVPYALYIGGSRQDVTEASLSRLGIAEQACFTFGPTVYVLRDAKQLAAPVKCRGWQGFWTLASDHERAVREQLA